MSFEKLKNKNSKIEIDRLKNNIRPDAGVHLKTKLKQFRKHGRKTLLEGDVRQTHAYRLNNLFIRKWGNLTQSKAAERLRFVTVLSSVCSVDENSIAENIQILERKLIQALSTVGGIEVIGVIEIEIVNFDLMKSIKSQGNLTDDESRKYTILRHLFTPQLKTLFDTPDEIGSSGALVHFHGIIDLGMNANSKEAVLKKSFKQEWSYMYQVEFDKLHGNKNFRASLQHIAEYVLKVDRDIIHYKIGFGEDYFQKFEAKMLKKGKKHLGKDYDGIEDPFSLSLRELEVFDNSIDQLMGRTKSTHRNGYLFKYGQAVKWVR